MDMNVTMNVAANELTAALEAMDPEILAGGLYALVGVFAAVFAVITTIGLLRYLLRAIGYAKMYHKAGVAPWKAFIPVYNTYNNYKLSWNGKLFFLYAALSIASLVLGFCTEGALALVSAAASIGVIYMVVKQNNNMAKLFGKGTGTTIALILFPAITSLVLGLGKAEYTAIEK
jgi:hypothetical protein